METLIERLGKEVAGAFKRAGYDEKYGAVGVSNRPDLCQYQCNGAMSAAKAYHCAPIQIAEKVVEELTGNTVFEKAQAVKPGFINLQVNRRFLADYMNVMAADERFGCEKEEEPKTIIVDYGGPNVAKPLHVGHLRSAIIGESIKRIGQYMGHKVIGDVHLGDWGLQMGLIITELKKRQPDLVYFDQDYTGDYPKEPPFTISELEEIYPTANAYAKEHPEFKEEAMNATYQLQNKRRGYLALWNHILDVSVADLKRNYDRLGVSFELWKKESDAQPYIPDMVQYLKEGGYAYLSEGALVVDVKEESDTKEIPPCMILKSDGATLYNTTDLATLVEREKLFSPDAVTYVVDKRQELYFEQVFRCARKTGLVRPGVRLTFLGFGTMNGKDGKPFKTREGGVMRLSDLIEEINEAVYRRIMENRELPEEEAREIAAVVGLSAIKYGDLSNQASKDYIFDPERFTSFEGNTGPYILYTLVRIKSILSRCNEQDALSGPISDARILPPAGESEQSLMLELVRFQETIRAAFLENAPHRICSLVYDIANAFNRFYHENKIISEQDEERKRSWISLLIVTGRILDTAIGLLGFHAPEKM